MSEGRVTYAQRGAVGHITFDRPQARNAMSPSMYAELDRVVEAIHADAELRCVVLRGVGGKSFAAGSDIAQFLAFKTAQDGLDYERRMAAHLDGIASIAVPTIAAIEGFAIGGGLNMAACCDLRIATLGSQFGMPIAKGLGNCLSVANYARLLQAFGEGRTRKMLLLGELIGTEEASASGFLLKAVAPEALDAEVAALVGQVLANSPLSMRVSKAALGRLAANQVAEIEDLIRLAYASEDFHGAVRAFLDKQKTGMAGQVTKVLALMLGDRYGVGPELVAKLLETLPAVTDRHVVVVGDARVFERGCSVIGVTGDWAQIDSLDKARSARGGWSFLDRPFAAEVTPIGRVSADAGRETLDTLRMLAAAAKAKVIDGIVYAPLNKQAMRDAGHARGDEADYFARRFKQQGPIGEINILGEVWTSRVTSHVPLREVGNLITRENVLRGVRLLAGALTRSGKTPRLAMAALNPHAGEGGAFGREEIDVLAPAIADARAEGIDIEGPFASDTVFPRAVSGAFNGVVTMFHDQGQIALKMVGLGKGITLLAGFPIPIATPGHGTAFDIAGTGTAKVDGLGAAVELVARMMGDIQ